MVSKINIHLNPDILNHIGYNQNQLEVLDSTNLLLGIDENHHYFIVDKTPIHYINTRLQNGILEITDFITLAPWINGFYEIMLMLLQIYNKIIVKKTSIPLYIEKIPDNIISKEEDGVVTLNIKRDS
jgi:hypothetical protein